MIVRFRPYGPMPLCNGDRMKQPEFHRRYEACPDGVHFELVGGIVYMSSPMRQPHGAFDIKLSYALETYATETVGVEVLGGATTILGDESEPEPDLALRILEEYGGRSWIDKNDYIIGPPELLSEIAHSTLAIDLNQKREDYERAGVLEYLVLSIKERELHWFDFAAKRKIMPDKHGIFRSRVSPGLWIDGPALLARRSARVADVMREGLASREHAAFVKKLEATYRKRKRRGKKRGGV